MASGVEQGAELVIGGKRPEQFEKGFFFEPTVFIGTNEMRIAQEEIFGPVLTVVPYSGEDEEAIRIANDSIYGLGGGVFSGNTSHAFNVARRVRAGFISAQGVGGEPTNTGRGAGQGPGWGTTPAGIGQEGAFGGFKQSGLGREWGHLGLEGIHRGEVADLGLGMSRMARKGGTASDLRHPARQDRGSGSGLGSQVRSAIAVLAAAK